VLVVPALTWAQDASPMHLYLYESDLPDSLDAHRREFRKHAMDVALEVPKYILVINKIPNEFPEKIISQYILKYKFRTEVVGKVFRIELALYDGVKMLKLKEDIKNDVFAQDLISTFRTSLFEFLMGKKLTNKQLIDLEKETQKRIDEISKELKAQVKLTKIYSKAWKGEKSNFTPALQSFKNTLTTSIPKKKNRQSLLDLLKDDDDDIDFSDEKRELIKNRSERSNQNDKAGLKSAKNSTKTNGTGNENELTQRTRTKTKNEDLKNELTATKESKKSSIKFKETFDEGDDEEADLIKEKPKKTITKTEILDWDYRINLGYVYRKESLITVGLVSIENSFSSLLGVHGQFDLLKKGNDFLELTSSYHIPSKTNSQTPSSYGLARFLYTPVSFKNFHFWLGPAWESFHYYALNQIGGGITLNQHQVAEFILMGSFDFSSHNFKLNIVKSFYAGKSSADIESSTFSLIKLGGQYRYQFSRFLTDYIKLNDYRIYGELGFEKISATKNSATAGTTEITGSAITGSLGLQF